MDEVDGIGCSYPFVIGHEGAGVVEAVGGEVTRVRPGQRIAIDPATGEILKIEWSESRVGRHEIFDKRGELYHRTPRLTIVSEFIAEKNGIRFPSRYTVKEIYRRGTGGAKYQISEVDVVYDQYKFFTVETEAEFKKWIGTLPGSDSQH